VEGEVHRYYRVARKRFEVRELDVMIFCSCISTRVSDKTVPRGNYPKMQLGI
jgi:hypothetical protein